MNVNGGVTLRLGPAGETWAHTLGYGFVSDLEIQHRWSTTGGGLHVVSFTLALPAKFTHPHLRQGVRLQVCKSGLVLGTALLGDVDRDGWALVADGLYKQAGRYSCEGSTNPKTVVAAANARGMGWNGTGNLPDVPFSEASEDTAQLNFVADLLTRYCEVNHKRWGLDAANVPYIADDPTTASLFLQPGSPAMATADDDYASRVVVRYVSKTRPAPLPAYPEPAPDPPDPPVVVDWGLASWPVVPLLPTQTPHGVAEHMEDITDLGLLDPDSLVPEETPQFYARKFYDSMAARPAYTEGIEPDPGQLVHPSGVEVAGWEPITGRRVRQYGVLDSDGAPQYGKTAEWVAGGSTWRPDSDGLQITPTELAERALYSIQAATTAATEKGFT